MGPGNDWWNDGIPSAKAAILPRPMLIPFLLATQLAFTATSSAPAPAPTMDAARAWIADTWRPLPTRRSLAILCTGAALGIASHQVEDAEASARALADSPLHGPARIGNAYGEIPVVTGTALLFYGAGIASGREDLRTTGFEGVRALVVSGAVVGGLKLAVKRTRPDGGRHSFPSGHAAATMALAPVITRHLGWRLGGPAYGLAVLSGIGRIQERRHHLSDVVWGATIGLAAGVAESQPRRGDRVSFEPFLDGDRIGCAIHF